ncbi:MAG TPA: TatD family hydrolase [Candidatus Saccharimonadales bacterium]|nr:TatD family hydrolase [Candidatus Saccharimonadales bacterium]
MIELTDTHCHIHEAARPLAGDDPTRALWAKLAQRTDATPDAIVARAREVGVTRLLCVGCTLADSELAIQFAARHKNVWASIGIHPHEAKEHLAHPENLERFAALLSPAGGDFSTSYLNATPTEISAPPERPRAENRLLSLRSQQSILGLYSGEAPLVRKSRSAGAYTTDEEWQLAGQHPPRAHERTRTRGGRADRTPTVSSGSKIVAIGECGLDYFYNHSPKQAQERILRFQIELALQHNLPLIFHVREAFADFWPIFDEYKGIRGVVHSFTATQTELDEALARGLYVALNGIMTFTKKPEQLTAAKAIPLNKLLLETDAPFLTPHPFRDTICEPKHTRVTAEFLAKLRGEHLEDLARTTTANAHMLFGV